MSTLTISMLVDTSWAWEAEAAVIQYRSGAKGAPPFCAARWVTRVADQIGRDQGVTLVEDSGGLNMIDFWFRNGVKIPGWISKRLAATKTI